ncbi:methyltransferase type 11 [Chlorella sorokiniana]|uniref:Methyltransferase type 11 n=1 Tax=Chlorella sorokiniana TaxID=3076 RepID=A0A2P6U3L6_CHLSO|nr:methyltransferase type 11 [Chlorella sorokiniana]|eukprot:PRW60904.1 methyltransferase type 11 [Chlorella sorokiniana]
MLARHVKQGGARVLQLGGSTRDIFYYPADTIQVTVGGPDVSPGLWEQAGMQAKVPVQAVKAEPQKVLSSQAGSTADSIVLLNQLQEWADMQQLLSQVYRVLKPGATLVFVQRLRGGPLQPLLGGSAGAVDPTLIDQIQDYAGWDFVQVDAALQSSDLHAVGVAVKPLTATGNASADGSVDAAAFEALMRRGKGKRQQQQQQAGGFQQKP